MIIQVNTDNQIDATAEFVEKVQSAVEANLGRFGERLTRVEVHLSDENSKKKNYGEAMRCRLEARPAGQQPVIVTADEATIEQAISTAAKKMERLLDSAFARQDDPRN